MLVYLIPLVAAMMYPLGSLWLKRAQQEGAGPWQSTVYSNWIMTACFFPLLLLQPEFPDWSLIHWPILAGILFFFGQLFTVFAVHAGDVSVQAPLMGCKVIFVALYSSFWLHSEALTPGIWIAAGLTAVAVFLLGSGNGSFRGRALGVVYALLSCIFFAATDALVGAHGSRFGSIPMLITVMATLSLASLFVWPVARRGSRLSPVCRRWLWYGSIAYGVQAAILGVGLSFFGKATPINIVYSSRGLFGIALVWFVGQWFANQERNKVSPQVMLRRLLGSLILCLAILLVIFA